MRRFKRFGQRQPRWLKISQGGLLAAGLLLLLWVPLFLFSSAAPTYAIPAIQAHRFNATLRVGGGISGAPLGAAAEFPLFAGGARRQVQQYLPSDSALPDELVTFSAEQFQLVCTAPDADTYWEATPPAQQLLLGALLADAGNGTGGVSLR